MLSARERSVLIVVDGQKQCAALSSFLPMKALAPILEQLEKLELIHAVATPPAGRDVAAEAVVAAAPAPVSPSPTPVAPADVPVPAPSTAAMPAHLAQARATMISTAESCLGLLAADVVRQIKAAEGKEQLQRALANWHMAMQASKHGREVEAQHLRLIKASMQTPV